MIDLSEIISLAKIEGDNKTKKEPSSLTVPFKTTSECLINDYLSS
jgi:hypothetical protein